MAEDMRAGAWPQQQQRHVVRSRRGALLVPGALLAAGVLHLRSWMAFVPGPFTEAGRLVERRRAVMQLPGIAAASVLLGGPPAARAVPPAWEGTYVDSKSKGCRREIVLNFKGTGGKFNGEDIPSGGNCIGDKGGFSGLQKGKEPKSWSFKVSLESANANELQIEETSKYFVSKEKRNANEPSYVTVKWDGDGIVFPDGTKWIKAEFYKKPETDVRTLKPSPVR